MSILKIKNTIDYINKLNTTIVSLYTIQFICLTWSGVCD